MSVDVSSAYNMLPSDQAVDEALAKHCATFGIPALDAIKHFPVLARRQWLKRFISHLELFKLTLEVPGHIAELGVFRGNGLMTWANLLETFCIGDRTKIVFGFDNWTGFGELAEQDGSAVPDVKKEVGGFSPSAYKAELIEAIKIFDSDRFVPWKSRVELVDGNIEETVPALLKQRKDLRFSLVHFDCDLYKPTIAALEALWPRVSRGGLLLFDEYAMPHWAGETAAVDEFIADKPELTVKTQPWNNTPGGYIIKL